MNWLLKASNKGDLPTRHTTIHRALWQMKGGREETERKEETAKFPWELACLVNGAGPLAECCGKLALPRRGGEKKKKKKVG